MRTTTWIGSWWGVLFASITAFTVGGTLGCVELILRKVEIVEMAPSNPMPNTKYFVKGVFAGGEDWQQKMSEIASNSARAVSLNEGDLNLFIQNSLVSDPKIDPQISGNVKIYAKRLHVGLFIRTQGLKDPLCIQMVGTFKKGPAGYYFDPKRTYVGTLPIPAEISIPLINSAFRKMFSGKDARGLAQAWHELKGVSLTNSALRLSWE